MDIAHVALRGILFLLGPSAFALLILSSLQSVADA